MNKTKSILAILLVVLLSSCSQPKNQPIDQLVTMDGVWKHLEQFDKIAKENNSNRAVGTPGGIASKDYIKSVLNGLGLTSTEQSFTNRKGAKGCNVVVEIKGKSAENVIMVGAHYDSVEAGPGINDNASGVAAVLEIIAAIQNNKIIPAKTLRFAFWDSEETGVEGSPYYYSQLTDADKAQIKAYLNVDMIASKDGEINISDTDGSTIPTLIEGYQTQGLDSATIDMLRTMHESVKFADGSLRLEELTKEAFSKLGFSVKEDLQFAKNSDTNPFMEHIPTLGINVITIIEEPAEDDGVAILYAPHYHQIGDDINNVDKGLLETCMKAVASVIQQIAIEGDAE